MLVTFSYDDQVAMYVFGLCDILPVTKEVTIMSEIDGDLNNLLTIFHRHIRVDWEQHGSMLEYTNEFRKRFRMCRSMFDDLVEELRIHLTVSFVQSMRSTSGNKPIYLEVIVAIGLRILGPSDLRPVSSFGEASI